MEPRIEFLSGKKLVGISLSMSMTNNKTGELWQKFMTRRKEIPNVIGADLFSLQQYEHGYFSNFNPNAIFKKWAAVEVVDFNNIPEGMEAINLKDGNYAVFLYKGSANAGQQFFQYIFGTWLPNSGYVLDDRLHFEILGEKYKNNSPDSEEEIWIPIKLTKSLFKK